MQSPWCHPESQSVGRHPIIDLVQLRLLRCPDHFTDADRALLALLAVDLKPWDPFQF